MQRMDSRLILRRQRLGISYFLPFPELKVYYKTTPRQTNFGCSMLTHRVLLKASKGQLKINMEKIRKGTAAIES